MASLESVLAECSEKHSFEDEELPLKVWLKVFDFVKPHEEFPLATVCREWKNVFVDRKSNRGQKKWMTWVGAVVHTVQQIDWARSQGCHRMSMLSYQAAENGYLTLLKWQLAHGVFRRSGVCKYAAENNHVDVFRWARANGCRWDSSKFRQAANRGDPDAKRWLIEG
jgi:hypothetical protein